MLLEPEAAPAAAGASALDEPAATTRELECLLNDTEIRERGEAMAAAATEVERLKGKRRVLGGIIRQHVDRMTTLAVAIDARKETREVACTWVPEYPRREWLLRRDDTGETVDTRAMTAMDLQVPLPGLTEDEPAPGPARPTKPAKRRSKVRT